MEVAKSAPQTALGRRRPFGPAWTLNTRGSKGVLKGPAAHSSGGHVSARRFPLSPFLTRHFSGPPAGQRPPPRAGLSGPATGLTVDADPSHFFGIFRGFCSPQPSPRQVTATNEAEMGGSWGGGRPPPSPACSTRPPSSPEREVNQLYEGDCPAIPNSGVDPLKGPGGPSFPRALPALRTRTLSPELRAALPGTPKPLPPLLASNCWKGRTFLDPDPAHRNPQLYKQR